MTTKNDIKKYTPYFIAFGLSVITIALSLIFTANISIDNMMENYNCRNIPLAVAGYIYIVSYMILCIVLRVKKQKTILKGLVIYQFIGIIAFIIHFVLLLADEDSFLTTCSTAVFYWWTLIYHEGAMLFVNLVRFPVRYVIALFLGMLTYMTSKSLHGIKIDTDFEEKVKDKHNAEEYSKMRAEQNIPQSAKDIESR